MGEERDIYPNDYAAAKLDRKPGRRYAGTDESTFTAKPESQLPEEKMEVAAHYARRAQIAMANGRHDAAMLAIIDHLENQYESSKPRRQSTRLRECGVSYRTAEVLASIDVNTVGDLAAVGCDQLTSLPNLAGRGIIMAFQAVLKALAPKA